MSALDTLIASLTERALAAFKEHGELSAPVWLLETKKGDRLFIMMPMEDGTPKDLYAQIIANMLKEKRAVRYAMAMEMWFLSAKKWEDLKDKTPSEQPDRLEGILIGGEDKNGETRTTIYEIERSSTGVTLKPADHLDGAGGRFFNLLVTEH